MDKLMKVRSALNKSQEKSGVKLSVTDFIVKASALSLMQVPAVNSSWQGDTVRRYASTQLKRHQTSLLETESKLQQMSQSDVKPIRKKIEEVSRRKRTEEVSKGDEKVTRKGETRGDEEEVDQCIVTHCCLTGDIRNHLLRRRLLCRVWACRYHSADISIAVQTEHGLMVPIVKDADSKGLKHVSSDIKVAHSSFKASPSSKREENYQQRTHRL
jgi:pyruvate/2-oxoglutarate dehydrogenase complex dihydrolipoamide acyltransferase (E2) component